MISQIIREFILPPGGLLSLILAAYFLRAKAPQVSKRLAVSAVLLLYLLSLAPVAHALAYLTYSEPVLTPSALSAFKPQALVVLGGGREVTSPEYEGAPTPSRGSLQRVRYAAQLAKSTGLPVMASGGYGQLPRQSEAWALRDNLSEYGVIPRWTETESRTTAENAALCQAMLGPEKIERIVLVTSAAHAKRARQSFEKVGFEVLSAPTAHELPDLEAPAVLNVIPQAKMFSLSCDSLRAHLGQLWYRILGV